jgi:hypothetical protein
MEGTVMAQLRKHTAGSLAVLGSAIAWGLLSVPAVAAEISHGEVAGAIRSANHPCAHVLKIDGAGDNAWVVTCNSGTFSVSRDKDGRFTVTKSAESARK